MNGKELRKVGRTLFMGGLLTAAAPLCSAADSVSVEFGSGDNTKMIRVGAQWKWEKTWWRSNGRHIGSYWDVSLAQWHGDRYRNVLGSNQNITAIGITPVFRFQNDNQKGFYAEGGIGAYVLSELYNNGDKQLSTSFQFGDHIGIGYVFANNADLGLKIQHFSNASIKKPNDGVNFAIIRVSYPF